MEPAALDHLGVEVPLDGVGPLAKVVDLLGGRAGRLRGRSTARKSHSDVTKTLSTMFTTMRTISSQVLY